MAGTAASMGGITATSFLYVMPIESFFASETWLACADAVAEPVINNDTIPNSDKNQIVLTPHLFFISIILLSRLHYRQNIVFSSGCELTHTFRDHINWKTM